MAYDIPPFRPPSEAESLLVRVTRGCTWNKCSFCSMYKSMPFERRPLAEIQADILSVRDCYRDLVRSVFIGDSNSLVIPAGDFVRILELLYASFPHIERVTSYARLKTLEKKPRDDLRLLRAAGLTRLHVGLETGSAGLLQKVNKGCTPREAIAAGLKTREADFELSLYVLLGLGGASGSQEHARDTAEVLNRIDPHFIRVRTLQPQYGSLLYDDMQAGLFQKASPETILHEQRTLIENLETTSWYLSDHISNYVPLNGKLPEDKQALLSAIDGYLADSKVNTRLQSSFAGRDSLKQL
jgi:radical SAM superfamily enzyme YgiQ (UPF0313 family)